MQFIHIHSDGELDIQVISWNKQIPVLWVNIRVIRCFKQYF